MKIAFPGINHIFEIKDDKVNTLIIENQSFLVCLLKDLDQQLKGGDGKIVLSEDDKILSPPKNCELLSQFVPFELNTKPLISKLLNCMEKRSISADWYDSTQCIMSNLENYLYNISFDMTGDIVFSKLNASALIKAVGVGFAEEYSSLAEKIIDYMELVKEYDQDKLFITLNLRDYINDSEMNDFLEAILNHNIKLFMIECREREKLIDEYRFIIDSDLCEIC